MLIRHEHWPSRLHNYIHDNIDTPFVWGTFDCCLFTAGCIQAMTDQDCAAEWRGIYDSEEDIARIFHDRNYQGLTGAINEVAANFGVSMVSPKLAQRGDVVMFEGPLGPTLGVICDSRLVSVSLKGLYFDKLDRFYNSPKSIAWRI